MATRLPFTPTDEQTVLRAIANWKPRDRCLIHFGLNTGFRASELSSIRVGQVWTGQAVRDEITVARVCLKGGRGVRRRSVRSRTVPLNVCAKAALNDYLTLRQRRDGQLDPAASLFRSTQTGRGLLRWRINTLVRRAAEAAGLPSPERYGGHSMRKRFCHRVYEATGHDINLTRIAMSHAQISTTQRYLFADESAVRSAILAIGA